MVLLHWVVLLVWGGLECPQLYSCLCSDRSSSSSTAVASVAVSVHQFSICNIAQHSQPHNITPSSALPGYIGHKTGPHTYPVY